MVFNLIVAGMVLGLAYAWMVRGFFNSLLHLLCVLVSGAIAFAFWEPLAYLLVGASPERGFFSFLESAAWGIALIVPFSASLLLSRLAIDKIVKGNVKNAGAVDYAGGAVCGLSIGILITGIFVLALQPMRLPSNFLGYQPIFYTTDRSQGAGSLVRTDSLWIPADRITAAVYKQLSVGTMSTGEPLARWYPDLTLAGFSARISTGDGSARNTLAPESFELIQSYTVGTSEQPLDSNDLLSVAGQGTPQRYVDINGDAISAGYIAGYVLEFDAGAKERGKRGGQVMVSNGQLRLVAENEEGETITVHPITTISESRAADGTLGRWLYDSDDVFITSVGGQSKVKMGFEFAVPTDYTPIGLYVKQSRLRLEDAADPIVYAAPAERDRRVRSGSILDRGASTQTTAVTLNDSQAARVDGSDSGSGAIASNRLNEPIATQVARRKMSLDDTNRISGGDHKFAEAEVGRSAVPADRSLRVDSFSLGRAQKMVQIDVSFGQPMSLLGEAGRIAPTDQSLVLIDSRGNEYEAVGFQYQDNEIFHVRYTTGSPLSGLADTPTLSRTRDDQELVILFIVTDGVEIEKFVIGDVVMGEFNPSLDTDAD